MEVAGLFAASIARVNPDAVIYQFSTQATRVRINPLDTVFTNTQKITTGHFGGTSISSGLQALMRDFKAKDLPDNVIIISDNESWADCYGGRWGRGTGTMKAWADYKAKKKDARMVLMDLTPTSNTQVEDRSDTLNVGGFSDQVFDVIGGFIESRGSKDFWVDKIREFGEDLTYEI
jgi:60 kDa SS-A/Ro ribonucleoprotein